MKKIYKVVWNDGASEYYNKKQLEEFKADPAFKAAIIKAVPVNVSSISERHVDPRR